MVRSARAVGDGQNVVFCQRTEQACTPAELAATGVALATQANFCRAPHNLGQRGIVGEEAFNETWIFWLRAAEFGR